MARGRLDGENVGGMKGGLCETLGEGVGMERRWKEWKEVHMKRCTREMGWRCGGKTERRPV